MLEILCQDIITQILQEWIGNQRDFISLDIAILNKTTREKYLTSLKALQICPCSIPFHLASSPATFPTFLTWCNARSIFVIQQLQCGYNIASFPSHNPGAYQLLKGIEKLYIHTSVFATSTIAISLLLEQLPHLQILHIHCERLINILSYPVLPLDDSFTYFPTGITYPMLSEISFCNVNFPYSMKYLTEFLSACPGITLITWEKCSLLYMYHILRAILCAVSLQRLCFRQSEYMIHLPVPFPTPDTIQNTLLNTTSTSSTSSTTTQQSFAATQYVDALKEPLPTTSHHLTHLVLEDIENTTAWYSILQLLCPHLEFLCHDKQIVAI